jgi:hypothetical protein
MSSSAKRHSLAPPVICYEMLTHFKNQAGVRLRAVQVRIPPLCGGDSSVVAQRATLSE